MSFDMSLFKSKKSFDNLDDFFKDLLENSVDFMDYAVKHKEGVLIEFEVIERNFAIHKWITNMCSGETEGDCCGFYRLSKDNLEDLIHKCDMIKNEFLKLGKRKCLIGEYIRETHDVERYVLPLKSCIESFKNCLKEIENGYNVYYYFNA